MRTSILTISILYLLLFGGKAGAAQDLYPLAKDTLLVPLRLGAEGGKLRLQVDEQELRQSPLKNGFPQVDGILLEDAAMAVKYHFTLLKTKGIKDVDVRLELRSGGGRYAAPWQGRWSEEPEKGKGKAYRKIFRWDDILEHALEYGESYTLYIEGRMLGNVNCEEGRPELRPRQLLPQYSMMAVGLGLFSYGKFKTVSSSNTYQEYKKAWEQGREADQSIRDNFESATNGRATANWTTISGLAVFGAGLGWLIQKKIRLKKRQQIFDIYCPEPDVSWQLTPNFYPSGFASDGPVFSAGLDFTIIF
ncbi:MAG: hypothetical protein R2824_32335 [Saprospiraceae bacterium]|nr:hypothetical protein [Lewinella sp.]